MDEILFVKAHFQQKFQTSLLSDSFEELKQKYNQVSDSQIKAHQNIKESFNEVRKC